MYELYFDKYRLPIPPEKIKTKINNSNKTIDLINGGELNFLKTPGLTDYEFTFTIPQSDYPFADNSMTAQDWLSTLEILKTSEPYFRFKIIRTKPNGEPLFNTGDDEDSLVSLEDYSFEENAKNLFDIEVTVKLKQYRVYSTGKIVLSKDGEGNITAEAIKERPSDRVPPKSYTVKSGDTLWLICKKELGDGDKWKDIAKLNSIDNPYNIQPGQVIKFV